MGEEQQLQQAPLPLAKQSLDCFSSIELFWPPLLSPSIPSIAAISIVEWCCGGGAGAGDDIVDDMTDIGVGDGYSCRRCWNWRRRWWWWRTMNDGDGDNDVHEEGKWKIGLLPKTLEWVADSDVRVRLGGWLAGRFILVCLFVFLYLWYSASASFVGLAVFVCECVPSLFHSFYVI